MTVAAVDGGETAVAWRACPYAFDITDRAVSMDDARGGATLEVTTRSSPQGARVMASGELDLATAERFVSALRSALAAGGAVTLDAAGLTFLDSSGLRALDEVHREALRTGVTFSVAPDFRPAVRRTLELSGMLAVLPVLPDASASR